MFPLLLRSLALSPVGVGGDVPKPFALTADVLAKLPRASLIVTEDSVDVRYDGVLLYDVLTNAGVEKSEKARRASVATYIRCEATDGYQVLFSLAELDPEFSGHDVLLADRRNGEALPLKLGPCV